MKGEEIFFAFLLSSCWGSENTERAAWA